MFYIGYSSLKRLSVGYNGTVSSHEYKKLWNEERKNNPSLFKTRIIKHHTAKEKALEHEQFLHDYFNVAENSMFINRRNGSSKFYCRGHSEETRKKISAGVRKTFSSDGFDTTKMGDHCRGIIRGPQSKETIAKLSKLRKGKRMSENQKRTISNTLKGRLLRPRNTLCKSWKITNIKTGILYLTTDRISFCSEHNIPYASFSVRTRNRNAYKKEWLCEKNSESGRV